ncbi:deoxyribodipyrimidine photo-lyase [Acidocella sp.]|uniref:cryptochrome/photolyase family protein n=1 Tax=Acidocella sp. TaxID=50710 RepID=UPI002627B23D|nr:deoxyribodipyrimidine photo-lyase [Acidocella sp.]
MSQPVRLMWFRGDLRLADNPALHAACAAGGPVALVYVLDERAGAASRWWLHQSLTALSREIEPLGGHLILRRGEPLAVIPALAAEIGAGAVHVARAFEPAHRALDRALDASLKTHGIALHRHQSLSLFAPERILTKTGTPYGVFTPFAKACQEAGIPDDACPRPARIQGVQAPGDDLASWALLPTRPDWAGGLRAEWQPGEAGAQQRLNAFLAGPMAAYATARDLPGRPGTSKLSPHIHFGEISPRRLWHAATQAEGQGTATFLKELLWREFSLHLLWQHPTLRTRPIRPEFEHFPWQPDPSALQAWQSGRTGVPIVDAGMRELWRTGWMHNRVRMICASYLVKHLLIPWQAGEAWFWDTLVDADEAANGASWQWVAGCGADAAPYFRIFNPVLQGQKFDPEGQYVRRFVPELARLPNACLHAPWLAPPSVLAAAGVRLGTTYPRPQAELAEGRARALAAFAMLKG